MDIPFISTFPVARSAPLLSLAFLHQVVVVEESVVLYSSHLFTLRKFRMEPL
jgi:hypothetical protein